jgi:hypothetical protein
LKKRARSTTWFDNLAFEEAWNLHSRPLWLNPEATFFVFYTTMYARTYHQYNMKFYGTNSKREKVHRIIDDEDLLFNAVRSASLGHSWRSVGNNLSYFTSQEGFRPATARPCTHANSTFLDGDLQTPLLLTSHSRPTKQIIRSPMPWFPHGSHSAICQSPLSGSE